MCALHLKALNTMGLNQRTKKKIFNVYKNSQFYFETSRSNNYLCIPKKVSINTAADINKVLI